MSEPYTAFDVVTSTGSTPTDALIAMNALFARVVLEVARRRQEELPGLTETLQDQVLITSGGTSRRVLGHFAQDAWRLDDRRVHELFLSADRRDGHEAADPVEDVFTTLLHEACHAYAQASGIKDTSRDGRYHNRRFAGIALVIGLEIEKDTAIGHRTPGLAPQARVEYADLLAELADGLTLAREPELLPTSGGEGDRDLQRDDELADEEPPAAASKYIFAACQCRVARSRTVTIRVARGSWQAGRIRCSQCGSAFTESLTGTRQTDHSPRNRR